MRREFTAKVMVAAFERAAGHCESCRAKLTADRLRELLQYNPETGIFTRRSKRGRYKAGAPTGCVSPIGYLQIRVDQKLYYAHRLAWLYAHGRWPVHMIDHIDGDKLNNRLTNLREATAQQNAQNVGKRSHNTSGLKGVYWDKERQKWGAAVGIDGRFKSLGRYSTREEAHAAYVRFVKELHGDFARFE